MKLLKPQTLVLLLAILTSCGSLRNFANSDYSYDGNFNEYSTYDIITNENLNPGEEIIENSIKKRLTSMGYKSAANPSLYIFYETYNERFKMRTFEQKPFNLWNSMNQETEESEKYEIRKSRFSGNSLVISFYDPEKKETVWRGYTTGLGELKPYQVTHVVNRILDQYPIISSSLREVKKYASSK